MFFDRPLARRVARTVRKSESSDQQHQKRRRGAMIALAVAVASPANLLLPGQARVMGDGWETSRRRDQANDWVEVRLACAGSVEVVELDTSHFVGNAPGWATLSGDGGDLLPRTALQPDTRHRFAVPGGPVTGQVRLDIYPDGGMARLRVLGRPTAAAREALADRFLRLLPEPQLADLLRAGSLPAAEADRRAGARAGLDGLPTELRTLFRLSLSTLR